MELNEFGWKFDANGINIVDKGSSVLFDLRNDYTIKKIAREAGEINIVFVKDSSVSDDTHLPTTLRLKISNVENDNVSVEAGTFEGIYDITASSINLCTNDVCVKILGTPIKMTLELEV
jgi:hypothetical protein